LNVQSGGFADSAAYRDRKLSGVAVHFHNDVKDVSIPGYYIARNTSIDKLRSKTLTIVKKPFLR
jgi:hypothetical protein